MSIINTIISIVITAGLLMFGAFQARAKYLYGCQQGAMRYCSFIHQGCDVNLLDDVQSMCKEDLK